MTIAISATGTTLEADVDPRFGRCQYFILVNPETLEFEAVENSSAMAAGGAGIATAQTIADKGVEAVLTGNCGPNAYQVLNAVGIKVITGISGKVKTAVEEYKRGTFTAAEQPNVADHFGTSGGGAGGGGGMGGGMGRGMGGGMGRGMGDGMGRGMGRGMGGGMGRGMMSHAGPATLPANLEQDLGELKSQTQILIQQVTDIQRRLDELEKR